MEWMKNWGTGGDAGGMTGEEGGLLPLLVGHQGGGGGGLLPLLVGPSGSSVNVWSPCTS